MSILCHLTERALALRQCGAAGPLPGVLSRHLERCDRCRRTRIELADLAGDLETAMRPPLASVDLTAATMARIGRDAAPRRVQGWRYAVVGAGAIGLMGAWLLWNPLPPVSPQSSALRVAQSRLDRDTASERQERPGERDRGSRPNEKPPAPPERPRTEPERPRSDNGKRTPPVQSQPERSRDDGNTRDETLLRILLRSKRQVAQGPAAAGGAGSAQPVRAGQRTASAAAESPSWTEVGAYYASNGDYRHAAAAYSRAAEVTGDPSVAFAAGWTAEASGDIVGAIEHYGRLLGGEAGAETKENGDQACIAGTTIG